MEYKAWLEKHTDKKTVTSKIEELLQVAEMKGRMDVIITANVKGIYKTHNDSLTSFAILSDGQDNIQAGGDAYGWHNYELNFTETGDKITINGIYFPDYQRLKIESVYNHSLEERMGKKDGTPIAWKEGHVDDETRLPSKKKVI